MYLPGHNIIIIFLWLTLSINNHRDYSYAVDETYRQNDKVASGIKSNHVLDHFTATL